MNDYPRRPVAKAILFAISMHLLLFLLSMFHLKLSRSSIKFETKKKLEQQKQNREIATLRTQQGKMAPATIILSPPTDPFTPPSSQTQPTPKKQTSQEPAPQPPKKTEKPKVTLETKPKKPQENLPPMIAEEPKPQKQAQQKPAKQQTKLPSFVEIIRGFYNADGKSGTDEIARKGNSETNRPDLEELKLLSYRKKVATEFQQAMFKETVLLRGNKKYQPAHKGNVRAAFRYEIDKSGKLLSLRLTKSSGISDIDEILESTLRSAFPLPPIPKALGHQGLNALTNFEINTDIPYDQALSNLQVTLIG